MTIAGSPGGSLRVRWLLFFLLIFALLLSLLPAWALPVEAVPTPARFMALAQGQPANLAVSGQALIRVASTTTTPDLEAALAASGCRLIKRYTVGHNTIALAGLPAGYSVPQGVALLQKTRLVLKAEPDRLGPPARRPPAAAAGLLAQAAATTPTTRVPNDPQYKRQYQWPLCGFPVAWHTQTGNKSIIVAIADSGIDASNPDLAGRLWVDPQFGVNGYNMVGDTNPPSIVDKIGEGTFVAGLIGAATNNGLGVAGGDWNCQLMTLRITDDKYDSPQESALLEAIQYAVNYQVNVLNCSMWPFPYTDIFTTPLADAYEAGIVVCAAAGDYGESFSASGSNWMSPVCNDGPDMGDNCVLGVTACDSTKKILSYANLDASGQNLVDIVAPGESVLSTYPVSLSSSYMNPGYAYMSGTMAATPIVAAAAALYQAQFRGATPDRVIAALRNTCTNIDAQNSALDKGRMGAGLLNIGVALTPQPPAAATGLQAYGTPNSQGGSITITWSPSPDDKSGQNNVVKYELFKSGSKTGPWTLLTTITSGKTSYSYTNKPVPDGTPFYYRVDTFSTLYDTPTLVVGPAISTDTLSPAPVTGLTASPVPSALGGSITLKWPANYAAKDPQFLGFKIYRSLATFTDVSAAGPSGPVYLLQTLTNTTLRSYVDSPTTNGVKYWYAVAGYDAVGNENMAVTPAGPAQSFPYLTVTYAAGTSMIALPLLPPTTDMGKILGITATNGVGLAAYDVSSTTGYDTYAKDPTSPLLEAALGRAYWLNAPTGLRVRLGGMPAPAGDFTATLAGGWNMLGNPFTAALLFGQSQIAVSGGTAESLSTSNANGQTDSYGWVYDTTQKPPGYKLLSASLPFAAHNLAMGQGFFFYSNVIGGFIFKRPATAEALATAEPAAPAPTESNWYLRLAAAVDGEADADNFLGLSPQAAAWDGLRKPPALSGGVELALVTAGNRPAATRFHQPGEPASWELQVTARAGAQVALTWPDLTTLPTSVCPLLTDLVTGQSVYLRTAPVYRFTAGTKPRPFRLTLAASGAVMLSSVTATAAGSRTAGSRAEITYALSAPAQVTVEVLNISGRLVRTICTDSPAAAGLGTVVWDGRNLTGAAVPTGVYLIRVTAKNGSGRRMSVLRTMSLQR